jgi:hypothetical protein
MKPPSSEMMGKTANGTATEGICRETGTLLRMAATWTLSTKRAADWDTNDEAILFLFVRFYMRTAIKSDNQNYLII